ncbi:MAG: hypothetical protein KDB24_15995, partial [Microthrixaceae bacterium]|nr:hypothetical protein [Microthrixaceae bacterium]
VDEWNKWEKTYKQWDERGWIDVAFNYEANAIPTDVPASAGKFKGFRLREKTPGSGDEEYIVEMLDGLPGSSKNYRRITGDIDPIDFTYADGSPLSPEDLSKLIKELQASPLGAEHGYTATFVGVPGKVAPGVETIYKQFKPNEPALQIAPDMAPRATRLDTKASRWDGPNDYNLRWAGGVLDAGPARARGPVQAFDPDFERIPLDAPEQIALPVKSKPDDPTVGRVIIYHNNEGGTAAFIMGANGRLQSVNPDGTTQNSDLHAEAFSEGDERTATVAPASTLVDDADGGGSDPVNLVSRSGRSNLLSAGAGSEGLPGAVSLQAGSDVITVSTDAGLAAGDSGWSVGQTLAIGTGTPNVELAVIEEIDGARLTLTEPLALAHEAGDVVMMVVSADGVPIDPTRGLDPVTPAPAPAPDPDPGPNPSTTPTSDPEPTPDPGPNPDTDPTPSPETDPTPVANPAARVPVTPATTASDGAGNAAGTEVAGSQQAGAGAGGSALGRTGTAAAVLLILGLALILSGAAIGRLPGRRSTRRSR